MGLDGFKWVQMNSNEFRKIQLDWVLDGPIWAQMSLEGFR